MKKPYIFLIIVLVLLAAVLAVRVHLKNAVISQNSQTTQNQANNSAQPANNSTANASGNAPSNSPAPSPAAAIQAPISNASSRITKKFFGTYVTPQNSPVKPERFTGFHTGLDFETTAAEKDADVQVTALCDGKLLVKGYASGYGGYAVQSCTISGKAVTVIYGHLRQSSIKPVAGAALKAGDPIAVLGTGYSSETDGERKHLHLGIHIGAGVNIKGYVQSKSELSGWMDPQKVLGL